jgi:oligopeptide/dipeptide ABC transporter ATP-binding protein
MTTPLLQLLGVGRDYPVKSDRIFGAKKTLVAVDRMSLAIMPGEILGLAGESGCGKSTLARLICRLEEPSRGEIRFSGQRLDGLSGEPLRRLRPRFQPVFQDPLGSLNPRFTAGRTLAEALRLGAGAPPPDALQAALRRVGLGREILDRYPHQLSGGQRQRLGLARALILGPQLLVADEPLSSLDVSIQAQVINLLLQLQQELQLAMLFISHDLRVVGHLSDRVLIMYLGRMMEQAPTRQLFARPLHPYTQALFQALPRLEPGRGRKRSRLSGEPATPVNPEPGCRFYSRCPFRQDACRTYENEPLTVAPGHLVACRRAEELKTES